jgi:hypothetical protein
MAQSEISICNARRERTTEARLVTTAITTACMAACLIAAGRRTQSGLRVRRGRSTLHLRFQDDRILGTHNAAHTVPACCQIVAFPDDATERRHIFAAAFLARAEAALENLEVRAALRRFADL